MNKVVKPFLKWAGGKTQLIKDIALILPKDIYKRKFTYIEPFVGSGSVLFWMINNFPNLKKAIINDINEDLMNTYRIIATKPKQLISILEVLQNEYHNLEKDIDAQKEYYYSKREMYNQRKESKVTQAALFIFLNRTCFNGLYRVNRNNEFNVPMGKYKKPLICDKENILAVNKALQKVEILCGDFEETINYAEKRSLFYLDPPYRPLNKTSNFTSYTKFEFGDNEQIRLRNFCLKLNALGHIWILSNSDVRAQNRKDTFFDELYADFIIKRVNARRSISAMADRRGDVRELLITNQSLSPKYVRTI